MDHYGSLVTRNRGSTDQKDKNIKVVMLGKAMVGKTSIVIRLKFDNCDEQTCATVGISFLPVYRGGINYEVWDTGGQERFRCLLPMHFRSSRIIIFVFDVTHMTSLDELDAYISDLSNLSNYYIIIIGNKVDMLTDEQLKTVVSITKFKISSCDLEDRIYGFTVVSAKTGENFNHFLQILHECAKEIIKHDKNQMITSKITNEIVVNSNVSTLEKDNQCSC